MSNKKTPVFNVPVWVLKLWTIYKDVALCALWLFSSSQLHTYTESKKFMYKFVFSIFLAHLLKDAAVTRAGFRYPPNIKKEKICWQLI